jgi:hypothetical protein
MKLRLFGIVAAATLVAGCSTTDLGLPISKSDNSARSDASANQAKSSSKPAPPPPMSNNERRRPITATGYAVISIQPHHLPAQQRLLAIRAAKLDAYRGLAEQVYGQYLDGATTIADATLRSDRVRARVEGMIHGAEVVAISPVGNDTYETTLSLDREVMFELRALYLEEMARLGR